MCYMKDVIIQTAIEVCVHVLCVSNYKKKKTGEAVEDNWHMVVFVSTPTCVHNCEFHDNYICLA